MKCKWEGVLMSIFNYFFTILAPKLGWKIDEKSVGKVIEKLMEKRMGPRCVKNRKVESGRCGGRPDMAAGRSPPLREGKPRPSQSPPPNFAATYFSPSTFESPQTRKLVEKPKRESEFQRMRWRKKGRKRTVSRMFFRS